MLMGDYSTLSSNSQNIKKFQLHQKTRTIILILVIGIPVFLAMLAYLFYQDAIKLNKPQTTNSITEESSTESTLGDSSVSNETIDDSAPLQAPADSPMSSPAQTSPSQPTTQSGIPDGVIAAINSIEANGVNNNPYIDASLDTSQIPVGTKITFDRNSWVVFSDTLGSTNISASILGENKTGSVTFSSESGTWKATGYSID